MPRKKSPPPLLSNPKIILSLGVIVIFILILISGRQGSTGFVKTPPFSQWQYQTNFSNSSIITSAKNSPTAATINFQYRNSQLEFEIPLDKSKIEVNQSSQLSFTTPKKDIEIKYSNISNGIKEDIILNKTPTYSKFVSSLKTTNADIYQNSDGLPVFFEPNTRKYLFHVQKPYAYDAAGNKTYAVTYQLLCADKTCIKSTDNNKLPLLAGLVKLNQTSTYKLAIKVDPEWLFDPKRVYPITIDPTIIHDTQTEFSTGSFNRVDDVGTGDTAPSLVSYYQELPADQFTVALWHMNESAGTTIADASGNNNTGTLGTGNSTPTLNAPAIIGVGISFDNNDVISLGNLSITDNISDITIESWLNPSDISAVHHRVFTENAVIYVGQYGGQLSFYMGNGTAWSVSNVSGGNLPINQWSHVAWVKNGTSYFMYINGNLTYSGTGAPDTLGSSSNTNYISYPNSQTWQGSLDEVRISNVARSADEIKANAQRRPYAVYTSPIIDIGTTPPVWNSISWTTTGLNTGNGETLADTTGLVAHWKFNEGSGTTAFNSAGTCGSTCNGVLTGFSNTSGQDVAADGWTSTNRRWGTGGLLFNIGQSVGVTSTNLFDFGTGDFSLSGWIKTIPNSDGWLIYHNDSIGGATGYRLGIWTNSILFGTNSGTVATDTSGLVVDGNWHYITGTRVSGTLYLYLDGILKNSVGNTGSATNDEGTEFFSIGIDNSIIDNIAVYSRGMSAAEVLQNYQAGNLNFQTRTGNTSNPNDGTWSSWSPSSGESQILSFDSDAANWAWDRTAYLDSDSNSALGIEGSGSLKIKTGQYNPSAISFWQLEETGTGVGTTFYDSYGTNHGVSTTLPSVITGFRGKARNFSTSQTITIPNESNFDFNYTSPFTISAWIKTTSTSRQSIFAKMNHAAPYTGYDFYIDANGLINLQYINTWTTNALHVGGTTPVNDGKWHYVSVRHAGTGTATGITFTIDKYADTKNTFYNTLTATTLNNISPTIGSRNSQVYFFNGSIDEVHVFNSSLGTEQIKEEYRNGRDHYLNRTISSTDLSGKNSLPFYIAADRPGTYLSLTSGNSAFANHQPDTNTVGFWRLEETYSSGNPILLDSSTNAINGTHGTDTSEPTIVSGKVGYARSFDGNDYISIGTNVIGPLLNGSSQITISGWINISNYPAARSTILNVGMSGVNTAGPIMGLTSTNLDCRSRSVRTDAQQIAYATLPPLNTWVHVACVIDYPNDNIKIYVNGSLASSTAVTFANTTYTHSTPISIIDHIGYASGATFFEGIIDEIQISKTGRTASEIRQAFESGLRTHDITIDFAANLDSGNLVIGSTDYSFSIDATHFGLVQKGSFIFPGDKIIIKEKIGTTEYLAQGTVNSVNASTGAITVASWDGLSTFPSSGFTVNADVFKWQREYWDLTSPLAEQTNATTYLTLRLLDGYEGRDVYLDDLRSNTNYISNSGSTIPSTNGKKYFQYRSILSSSDNSVSSALNSVSLDYTNSNIPPSINCRILNNGIGTSSFTFIWSNNPLYETGYEVQRSVSGAAWSVLQTGLAVGTSSITDSSVSPGNTYIYRVAPYYFTTYGPWCSSVQLSVGATNSNFNFGGVKLDGVNIN